MMNSIRTTIAYHRIWLLLLLHTFSVAAIHARLISTIRCVLFQKCVTFGPTEDHPRGYHRDYWTCKLSNLDSERLGGLQFVDITDSSSFGMIPANATSGTSLISVSEAIIDEQEARMYIPGHAEVFIEANVDDNFDTDTNSINVRLLANAKSTGILNTLVIRVIDSNGIEPTSSTDKLIDDVFVDEVSLKTQMEACSYNKLRIEPFRGTTPRNRTIRNGVVDIQMDYDITSRVTGIDNAALRAAKDTLGDLDDPMFDLVMICLPPGQSDYLAFAFNNSKYSFYNDEWCGYVGAQMHEVGHNLGLAHSGEMGEGEYGDTSGLMGDSHAKDDYRQCYNPQKSYQLGWYDDQTLSIDPLDESNRLPLEFTLNGIADYGRNPDAIVVLRLMQENRDQDYYIGYNHATGIHANTTEDADHVTVIRKDFGSPEAYGISTKMASLWVAQKVILYDFNGSGRDIKVAFTGITEGGDARVMILEGGDDETPVPPGNCQKFLVEVLTDGYPEDNSWYVVDTSDIWGRVWAISAPFDNTFAQYRQEICLPRGPTAKTYQFAIEDKYGDGIGFGGDSDVGYKVAAEDGDLLVSGGSDFAPDRKWIYHTLMVDGDPNYQPTAPPTQVPMFRRPVATVNRPNIVNPDHDGTDFPKTSKTSKKSKSTKKAKKGKGRSKARVKKLRRVAKKRFEQ